MKPISTLFVLASAFSTLGSAADIYVSTAGSDSNDGSSEAKAFATLTKAQEAVRGQVGSMNANINVHVAPGVYELSKPLVLTSSDSGRNGLLVRWIGPGALISGGRKITGWTAGSNGIYSAPAPTNVKSRSLYVNGQASNYARRKIANRKDLTLTSSSITWTNSAYDWITSAQGIDGAEVRFISSFTDRYSPIQRTGNRELVMEQNAWFLNNWGYDTVSKPNADFGVWVQNALGVLTEGGQFYHDNVAGKVYYKPLSGENLATADVRLGVLETLVAVAGTYAAPARDISFEGISFAHTTWLKPNTVGYVDQQTGGYMCENKTYTPSNFESSRPWWCQMQSGVQISAATNVVFTGGNFTQMGGGGVGIGNDANAHDSGVGLGANNVAIRDSYFSQIMGNSITAGGIRADAHHPSDARMTNTRVEISNNIFRNVSSLFSSTVPIFGSYLSYSNISNNDIDIAPYSGICYGYGWGSNDAGGSPEYVNRGLYNFQPKYTTPTISQNNLIKGNLIHRFGLSHTDLGALYTLSKSPSSVVTQNYAFDSTGFGVYTDEGSNSYAITDNILFTSGNWYARNGQNTANNTFTGNFGKSGGAQSGNSIVSSLAQASLAARRNAYRAGVVPAKRTGRPVSNPAMADGELEIALSNGQIRVTINNFDDAKFTGLSLTVTQNGQALTGVSVPTEAQGNGATVATYKAGSGTAKAVVKYTNSRTGQSTTLTLEKQV